MAADVYPSYAACTMLHVAPGRSGIPGADFYIRRDVMGTYWMRNLQLMRIRKRRNGIDKERRDINLL